MKTNPRDYLLTFAGAIGLVALVLWLLYHFYDDRVSPSGRVDALVIMTLLVPFAFVFGFAFGQAYVRGFRLGRLHSEAVMTSSRPTDPPPSQTVIIEPPASRLPTEFASVSPDLESRIIKALHSGEDETR